MKPMNFPARRLRRQLRAGNWPDGVVNQPQTMDREMEQARNTRTKIRRTHRRRTTT